MHGDISKTTYANFIKIWHNLNLIVIAYHAKFQSFEIFLG